MKVIVDHVRMFALKERHAAMESAKTPTQTMTIAVHVQTNALEIGNVAEEPAETSTVTIIVTADLAECHALAAMVSVKN